MMATYQCLRLALAGAVIAVAGCNSVLGVRDVELALDASGVAPTPDAARSNCKLDARLPQVTMTQAYFDSGGVPNLWVALSATDAMSIALRNNHGDHSSLQMFGVYQLTADDSMLGTCGICVLVSTGFDPMTNTFEQEYVASMHGELQISSATSMQLAGRMQDIVVRHVNIDTSKGTQIDAPDDCTTTIDEIDFNLPYTAPPAVPSAMIRALPRH